jgi:hypothetical protein
MWEKWREDENSRGAGKVWEDKNCRGFRELWENRKGGFGDCIPTFECHGRVSCYICNGCAKYFEIISSSQLERAEIATQKFFSRQNIEHS